MTSFGHLFFTEILENDVEVFVQRLGEIDPKSAAAVAVKAKAQPKLLYLWKHVPRSQQAIIDGAALASFPKITPIATTEYPTPAIRPANSILDCSRTVQQFGIAQPSWRVALSDVLAEIKMGQSAAER